MKIWQKLVSPQILTNIWLQDVYCIVSNWSYLHTPPPPHTHSQNPLKGLPHLTCPDHSPRWQEVSVGIQGKDLEGRNWSRDHEGVLSIGLLHMVCSASSITPLHLPGVVTIFCGIDSVPINCESIKYLTFYRVEILRKWLLEYIILLSHTGLAFLKYLSECVERRACSLDTGPNLGNQLQ